MGKVFRIAALVVSLLIISIISPGRAVFGAEEQELRFAEGSPAVFQVVIDLYKSADLESVTQVENFKGRRVVVFDREGQVVEEFNLDENGNVVIPSIVSRSVNGNQSVRFFSHSDSHTPDEVTFSVIHEFFDEQMRLSKKNTYNQDKDGTAYLTYTESREYTGVTETITKLNRDGCMVSKSIRTLDENGQILQTEFYTDLNGELRLVNKTTFDYDDAGNLLKEARFQDYDLPWLESVYEYDNLNRKTKCITYEYGKKTSELEYEYTTHGKIIYLIKNGERRLHFCKELNDTGELAWIARWNPEKERLAWIEYVYSGRDEFGNWTIEQRIFHTAERDGEVTTVFTTVRQIVYYPEFPVTSPAGENVKEGGLK